ncbi:MAG: FAD-binding oxidoreductase [Chitinivibrionales bacterium]
MKSIIGKEHVLRSASQILFDESRLTVGIPDEVYYPESEEDMAFVFQKAGNENKSITGIGGQTGITGSGVPDEGCIALCFENMNSILRVEADGDGTPILVCRPGITLESIESFLQNPSQWPQSVAGSEGLKAGGWFYSPDPTEMTAQLGGSVATNASGARSFRFGATRRHVVYLKMMLSTGAMLTITRGDYTMNQDGVDLRTDDGATIHVPPLSYRSPDSKNASGYFSQPDMDCIDLFIGSEGTLGFFCEIGIRLLPKPVFTAGLSFFTSRTDAFAFADILRARQDVSAIEYFDSTALDFIARHKYDLNLHLPDFPVRSQAAIFWEHAGKDEEEFEERLDEWEMHLQSCDSTFDNTWSGLEPAERSRLRTFRHAIPEAVNHMVAEYKKDVPEIRKIGTDTAVPAEAFQRVFDDYLHLIHENTLQAVIFGHLGDYHLHFNLLPASREQLQTALSLYERMMSIAVDAGGTISAEHGIGKIKAGYLERMYGEDGIRSMKEVKKALDPGWRLNRGTLFGE